MSHAFLFIYLCVWGGELKELPLLTERETEAMISGSKLVKAPHCWGRGSGQMEGELPQKPHAPHLLSCTCLKS